MMSNKSLWFCFNCSDKGEVCTLVAGCLWSPFQLWKYSDTHTHTHTCPCRAVRIPLTSTCCQKDVPRLRSHAPVSHLQIHTHIIVCVCVCLSPPPKVTDGGDRLQKAPLNPADLPSSCCSGLGLAGLARPPLSGAHRVDTNTHTYAHTPCGPGPSSPNQPDQGRP